jgi:hypothetical protein
MWTTPEEPNPEEASREKPGPEVPPTVAEETKRKELAATMIVAQMNSEPVEIALPPFPTLFTLATGAEPTPASSGPSTLNADAPVFTPRAPEVIKEDNEQYAKACAETFKELSQICGGQAGSLTPERGFGDTPERWADETLVDLTRGARTRAELRKFTSAFEKACKDKLQAEEGVDTAGELRIPPAPARPKHIPDAPKLPVEIQEYRASKLSTASTPHTPQQHGVARDFLASVE